MRPIFRRIGLEINLSRQTVPTKLNELGVYARSVLKKSLINKRNQVFL